MLSRTLEGKIAVITGGSRGTFPWPFPAMNPSLISPKGIGSAIARNLASRGCSLVLNYSSPKSSEQCISLAKELEEKHAIRCIGVQADMGSISGPADLIQTAKAQLLPGSPFRIDIIINNAGVVNNTKIEDTDPEDFDWMYRTNVRGPLLLVKAAIPYLPQDRSGRIVNVSSISSTEGFEELSIYGGTKAALEAMTRTWSRELAERCTVNAVNPGPVMTDMWTSMPLSHRAGLKPWVSHTPLAAVRPGLDNADLVADADTVGGRPAYSHEVAGIVSMLCSEESSLCTGQVICANGGMRMAI
ncbi:related to 3-oxoacyl-[acyl-carrier-protein] reductase [Rhynchosporium agropyri]|uniref:Related to 3-oxoacyl-[acyl-carrier-protein] reductase n=1 Tax=Rhynchosporium agropyri TaxID=914238 RepID=A0A1E1KHG2_9HELO|nr:related to 3-oxoacyl-[acyl-carrier-protein] reductase [Rhynchosporium agropyri]